MTLIDTIAAYLKTRDEAMGTPDQSDDERAQSATDIASVLINQGRLRQALADVKTAIIEADISIVTDTFWMPEKIIMGATVVDYIDLTLHSDGVPEKEWRCFHCDELFSTVGTARDHFGDHEGCQPACHINAKEYRKMERRMERYNAEDSDADRRFHAMQADHGTALIREEEKGYARGLADGQALVPGVVAAARAVMDSWDKRMGGDKERLATSTVDPSHQYWTPSGSLVDSEAIAGLRRALDGHA